MGEPPSYLQHPLDPCPSKHRGQTHLFALVCCTLHIACSALWGTLSSLSKPACIKNYFFKKEEKPTIAFNQPTKIEHFEENNKPASK